MILYRLTIVARVDGVEVPRRQPLFLSAVPDTADAEEGTLGHSLVKWGNLLTLNDFNL